jgi:hypothetical protein
MTASSDPMIVSYDKIIITINTSRASESNVCMKFLRNGKTDVIMSEPFKLKVINICPYYFNAKPIKDQTKYIYYNG